jgi:hypothetical protein
MKKMKPIKIRRTWGQMKPVTRVKQSKKLYRRDNRVNAE